MKLSTTSKTILQHTSKISHDNLQIMRALAKKMFGNDKNILIGINGSFARLEATQHSDADLFFLYLGNASNIKKIQQKFLRELTKLNYKQSSPNGVFAAPLSIDSICQNIGGQQDDNIQTTQRMLLLLEGSWIFNEKLFTHTTKKLLNRYVPVNLRRQQICLYLLNDIIRYWRTICVDYEFKINRQKQGGNLRLIKLRFSRKILYFAGILAVAATYNLPPAQKQKKLLQLFSLTPIQRLQQLTKHNASPALELYCDFLCAINDEKIRRSLQQNKANKHFDILRQKARLFDAQLLDLLHKFCGKNNPTLNSLLL